MAGEAYVSINVEIEFGLFQFMESSLASHGRTWIALLDSAYSRASKLKPASIALDCPSARMWRVAPLIITTKAR